MEKAIDVVCGMEVKVGKHTAIVGGNEYHFCCPACLKTFEKNPEQYITQSEDTSSETKHCGHHENQDTHKNHDGCCGKHHYKISYKNPHS